MTQPSTSIVGVEDFATSSRRACAVRIASYAELSVLSVAESRPALSQRLQFWNQGNCAAGCCTIASFDPASDNVRK